MDSDDCVCGGRNGSNDDCERCRLISRLRRYKSALMDIAREAGSRQINNGTSTLSAFVDQVLNGGDDVLESLGESSLIEWLGQMRLMIDRDATFGADSVSNPFVVVDVDREIVARGPSATAAAIAARQRFECDGNQPSERPRRERPDVGLFPRRVWIYQRAKYVAEEIVNRMDAGRDVPTEWVNELVDLFRQIKSPADPPSFLCDRLVVERIDPRDSPLKHPNAQKWRPRG